MKKRVKRKGRPSVIEKNTADSLTKSFVQLHESGWGGGEGEDQPSCVYGTGVSLGENEKTRNWKIPRGGW